MSKLRASYSVVGQTPEVVTIRDENGRVSVTNDAEAVVEDVLLYYGNKRIHYYDSDGNLDQLCHDGQQFTGFAPVQKEGRR